MTCVALPTKDEFVELAFVPGFVILLAVTLPAVIVLLPVVLFVTIPGEVIVDLPVWFPAIEVEVASTDVTEPEVANIRPVSRAKHNPKPYLVCFSITYKG